MRASYKSFRERPRHQGEGEGNAKHTLPTKAFSTYLKLLKPANQEDKV